MKRWLPSSLSSRLLAVFLITAITALILIASLFSRGLGSQWQRVIAPHLIQYVAYMRQDLGSPPDESRARALAERLSIHIQVHDSASGTMKFSTRDVPLPVQDIRFFNPQRWRTSARVRRQNEREPLPALNAAGDNIAISNDRHKPILRLGHDDNDIYIEFDRPRQASQGLDELLLAVAGLALLLGLCYLAIKWLLNPIGKLQSAVQEISNGDFTARTNIQGNDDLAILAQSVDSMSERIQQMLDAKRELLLAISHELRSPLTRARVAAELLEPSRHQHKLIGDIDEMESLIARLVESERLQTHVVLDLKNVDIGKLVTQTVNSFDAEIDWNAPPDSIFLHADESRLQVLLRNLVDNALQHGRASPETNATVHIRLESNRSNITLTVWDNGPGIDQEHLSSVTEPFYRPDSSRTRKTGGIGLGLHLCKRIVEAHRGTFCIESPRTGGIGVSVVVVLPRG